MAKLVLLVAAILGACVHAQPSSSALTYTGMGRVHRPIETRSTEAQQHFDAGLALAYGFNYDEAMYELALAIHADPSCAMCAWGYAYAMSPNINAFDKQLPGAYEAATRAAKLAKTSVERGLTRALLARLAPMPMVDTAAREKLNYAYAAAMREVARDAPGDDDVQTLLAEAALLATPLFAKSWNKDGTAALPEITEARVALETVLARSPEHIGAIHFYVHTMDGSREMEKAVPYAAKLPVLAPSAGHLVHMPSHLYLKLGRYADAEDANRAAIETDHALIAKAPPGSQYEFFTMHPQHYLWYVLVWEGKSREAEAQAKALAEVHGMMMMDPGAADQAAVFAAFTAARFGTWTQALALPEPVGPGSTIARAFARGLALVATGKLDEADKQVELIRTALPAPAAPATASPAPSPPAMPGMPAAGTVPGAPAGPSHDHGAPPPPAAPPAASDPPAPPMGPPPIFLQKRNEYLRAVVDALATQLAGAILAARGDTDRAVEQLRKAAALDDAIPDMGELSAPVTPARQRLGAVLLAAGRAKEAAEVYRADLAEHPENGWSLFGLARALELLKDPSAPSVRARFDAAWKRADVKLTSSVL
jgi:tetratricopeptide (TPR) repeat protein